MPFGVVEVTVRSAGRPFAEAVLDAESKPALRMTELGMVVCEHVDKLGFFESSVEVVEKECLCDGVRFVLRANGVLKKPLSEVIRGFKIGCFRIAREYRLVRTDDVLPIFEPGFRVRQIEIP